MGQTIQAIGTSSRWHPAHYSSLRSLNPLKPSQHNPDTPPFRTPQDKPTPLQAVRQPDPNNIHSQTGWSRFRPEGSQYLRPCHPRPRPRWVLQAAQSVVRKWVGEMAKRIDPDTDHPSQDRTQSQSGVWQVKMGGGQVCPVDHFIPNEGDKSDPSGDWVTFVPPSSLRSISGHPLRSIVDLASPSPSKHLAGLDLIFRRKKLDFGGKLPFEAFLAGEFIFCCILPLFHRSAIITWKQQYSSKDYAEVGVLTILSSSIAETSRRGWRVDNFKQQYSRNITQSCLVKFDTKNCLERILVTSLVLTENPFLWPKSHWNQGSSRSSVLGEANINLAHYADALKPSIVALPLQGCDSGAILHNIVSSHLTNVLPYLMPVVIPFREFEQQRELRERGLQTTCDESAGRKLFSDDTINAQMDKVYNYFCLIFQLYDIAYELILHDLDSLNKDLERRAATAEAALKRARLNYSIAVDQLQKDLELLSSQVLSMYETNENLIKQAFSESSLPSFPEYEEMAQNQKLDSKESHAARLLQCQNQFHEEKKQNLDADIFSEDLKRSLLLQKGLYQKVEEEVYEVHLLNVYLDVFSKTLQETLLDASADFRLMKDKINKLTQQLELSTESKELLMLKLQDATMRFTISRNTKMPVIQNATAWLCIIKL
ncbi:hypothetical protein FEM48_Zijuj06G0111800 [Ziziphus jujuba var. spinosa]|uniref:Uncharacterized protein n=1 Tax=Ziziphus jujuba var. spinosa TaxID=714518 RepID=A0A978V8Y2_ZIZJJ|nr:hypothetical protein FEM48_Zijuj06G0111800 [Ziziphus jujuba var. spinosa]